MTVSSFFALSLREYSADSLAHQHDHAQLVLPLIGSLDIDITGRGAQLTRQLAAYVEPGQRHAQTSAQPNRFLIVDLDSNRLPPALADHFTDQTWLPLSPEANSLIDYMGASLQKGGIPDQRLQLWSPLLLEALAGDSLPPPSRLTPLLAALSKDPFHPWTTSEMANRVGLSNSRLHAVFRAELQTTPKAWLAEARLGRVQHWLASTRLPLAEIAYRAGYADQSALTRALRKATGMTPAAYRACHQESRPKQQES